MTYTTRLDIAGACSGRRLADLVRSLQRHDCLVRLEPGSAGFRSGRLRTDDLCIDVRIPADGYTWIVTGGFRALLAEYADIVHWRAHFEQVPDRGGWAAPLPASSRHT